MSGNDSHAATGAPAVAPPRRGKVTIRQVAAAAGVSRATASRVISGSTLVSDQARQAVDKAISDLGFVPSSAARSLALGRSSTVALVLPEPDSRVLSDPFFASTILGLSKRLDAADMQMVLLIARAGQGTGRIVRYLEGGHIDGAVIASHHRDDTLNQRVVDSSLPCVFIGRPLGVPAPASYVDMDNRLGARQATEHLITTGWQRVATIAGPTDMSAGIDRLEGWRAALRDAGRPDDAIAHGDFTLEGGTRATRRLLAAFPDLDAVFAASDMMAAGALTELGNQGRRVPEDVAVIGFDNFDLGESAVPPLSTVDHPVGEMAARAGEMLLDLLAGGEPSPDPVLFAPQLVLRKSA